MSEPQLQIRVDTRERGKIIQRLEGIEGLEMAFEEMDVGDYVLPGDLVVERKSGTDLILSVIDQSLWDKVAKLKSQHEQVVYIVEGDLFTARFHQQALDVHRALAHMIAVQGVSLVPSPDAENSAMLIYLMGMARQEGASALDRVAKPSKRRDAQVYLLTALPGIDAEQAEALLKHFKSARSVMAASPEALQEVEGIDPELAGRIAEVLDFGS